MLYLIDYSDHGSYPVPDNPGGDRIVSTFELEKMVREKGWISKRPEIVSGLKTYGGSAQYPVQISQVGNGDGSLSPVVIYKDRILSPVETKECTKTPESLYDFLRESAMDGKEAGKILWKYFDKTALRSTACLSRTDWSSKAGRVVQKIRDIGGRKRLTSKRIRSTYRLTPEGELLRMGFDYEHFIGISYLRREPLMSALGTHFESEVDGPARDIEDIDVPGKGKYDFFGHTVYLDVLPPDDLFDFHCLIKSGLAIRDKESIDEVYESLKSDIIAGYRKLEAHEIFHELRDEDNLLTNYSFVIPIIRPPARSYGRPYPDGKSIAFSKDNTIFHELVELMASRKYDPKIGSIFASAASNVLDIWGSCGTKHQYDSADDGVNFVNSRLDFSGDEINFRKAREIARNIPHELLDEFVYGILDAFEGNDGDSFRDIDSYDVLLPYRDGRLFNPCFV